MLVVYTSIPFDPDRRDEALALVSDLVDHSRTEPGTIRYHATEDVSEPGLVRFFEQYEDAAAAQAHTESEPYREFVTALPDLVVGPIETVQFEAGEVEVVEFSAEEAVASLE